jgi:hypothetical protein
VGGGYDAERHIGINTRASSIVNQEDIAHIAWGALQRVYASGDRCGSCLATWNNGNDSSRDPRECRVCGDSILRGDDDDAPNASGSRERFKRPTERRLSGNRKE